MNRSLLTALTAAAALSLIGCEKKEASSAIDKAKDAAGTAAKDASGAMKDAADKAAEATKDAANKAGDMWKEAQTKLVDSSKKTLDEWKPTVDKIKAKVAGLTGADKTAGDAAVKEIDASWTNVTGMWDKLKTASATEWSTLSSEFSTKLSGLGKQITDAATKWGVK